MNTKEWFSIGVRIIGLLACLRGCEDFIWVLIANLGYTSVTNNFPSHITTLVIGLFYFFAGLYLIRGATLLVDSNRLSSSKFHSTESATASRKWAG